MGKITTVISDEVETRLRTFLWKKYRGKGRHMGKVVEQALTEFFDLHESEVE